MKFKVGDMVQIVSGYTFLYNSSTDTLERAGYTDVGKVGTIIGCGRTCYDVKLADGGTIWCAESVLRLIPGDPEGRQLVRWDQCDWRPSRSLVEA
jgi:hypothetical protein